MDVSSPSGPVRQWLDQLPAGQQRVVSAIRSVVGTVAPDAHEIVYHGALGYGTSDSAFDRILYLAAFRAHVSLGFFYGGYLADPGNLLAGNGRRMRHLRITRYQDCGSPSLRGLIEQAWADGRARVEQRNGKRRGQGKQRWQAEG